MLGAGLLGMTAWGAECWAAGDDGGCSPLRLFRACAHHPLASSWKLQELGCRAADTLHVQGCPIGKGALLVLEETLSLTSVLLILLMYIFRDVLNNNSAIFLAFTW